MPSHQHESSACYGVSRSNLFVEPDPENDPSRGPVAAAEGPSMAPQRGRRLVVPVVDGPLAQRVTCAVSDVAHPMRDITSLAGLLVHARRHIRRVDRNAQRLLGRMAARPYGALSALIAVAALLLTVSWLGISLRTTAAARDHARQQERAVAVAFEQAHRRLDTLTAQPVRGAGPAGAARQQQAAAAAAVATWRPRSVPDRRRLGRRAQHRHHR
jgi:hypothetical protein